MIAVDPISLAEKMGEIGEEGRLDLLLSLNASLE
jgi:hypothetical protein